MAVLVLDKNKKPLMPCSEKRGRLLLERRRARIHRLNPFTIRIVDRKVEDSELQSLRIKIDPGSKVTGIALVREAGETIQVKNLFEVIHRGRQISERLTARRNMRRRRRGNLRYRRARFLNRRKLEGWLAPSLRHRIDSTMSWVDRLRRWAPITAITTELVRFDMQKIDNSDIEGIEYQQGALQGYELREYLLEKWQRKCVYCDAKDAPLNLDHIQPKASGGSNRASNLTLACKPCNQKKGSLDIRRFVEDKTRLARILTQTKRPLRDAAAVNATRRALVYALETTGLPVETGSGGRTKWNRSRLGIPKTHALDAACVGEVATVLDWQVPTLDIKATGRGSYQRTRLDKYGFPRGFCTRSKRIKGFQTGDMVRAVVPSGKKTGTYIGRVAVRATGSFNIQTCNSVIQGINVKYCTMLSRADGYSYLQQKGSASSTS